MTVVACIFLPFVLLYQGWTYWVFRKRLGAPPQPASAVEPRSPQTPEPQPRAAGTRVAAADGGLRAVRPQAAEARPAGPAAGRGGGRPRGGGRGPDHRPGAAARRRRSPRPSRAARRSPRCAASAGAGGRGGRPASRSPGASEIASYRASAAVKAELRRSFLARAVELGPRWLAGRRSAELTALATEGIEALDGYFVQVPAAAQSSRPSCRSRSWSGSAWPTRSPGSRSPRRCRSSRCSARWWAR